MHMGRGTMMAAGGMILRGLKAAKCLLTANSGFILFYFILGEHQFRFSWASQETFIGGACARQELNKIGKKFHW